MKRSYIFILLIISCLLAGCLWGGARPSTGTLTLAWDFEHYFPEFRQQRSTLSLAGSEHSLSEQTYIDLIAHFKTEGAFEKRQEILSRLGFRIKGEIPLLLAVLVTPEAKNQRTLDKWAAYEDSDLVLEPNWLVGVSSLAQEQVVYPWYLEYVRIPQAHAITTGSKNVRIAILDTGLNPQGLGSGVQVLPGYNFIGENTDTTDDHLALHGTNIAHSVAGVMPEVSIQPVKVLNNRGEGDVFQLAEGLLFAADLHDFIPNPTPAQIINLSLGADLAGVARSILQESVEQVFRQNNTLMIAASGNWSRQSILHPAAFAEVLAIGAIEPKPGGPERAYYSHYGAELDLVAPPTFQDGTSFSTAIVSGVAGLMLSNGIPAWEIRETLTRTAMDLGRPGFDLEHGHGLVNAHWAVLGVSHVDLELKAKAGETILQEKIPLEKSSKSFKLAPGEYTVQIWLNLSGQSEPAPGDYLASASFSVVKGQADQVQLLRLSELGL